MAGQSQGLVVQTGAYFKTTGNVSIVIQNGNLTNNGSTDFAGSNIYFTGSTPGTFGGSSSFSINNLYINTPSTTVSLGHDVNISNQVILQGGTLNLNGKTIALSPSGSLTGETETNRIISPAGGEITITAPLNAPLAENPGNLGAIINSAADMGSVTIKRGNKAYSNVIGANSIQRYYDINPQNNTGLAAFLRFKYLDAELNGLSEATLSMFRSVDSGATWTSQGFSGRNTTSNFVDLSNINSFSRWTLSSQSLLPVTLTGFNASCNGKGITTKWETATELNADKFEVQRSADSRQWETMASVAAKGNSVTTQNYTWNDAHPLNYAFYRLVQVDKDGRASYSSIKGAGCIGTPRSAFAVYPNPVKDILKVRIISPVKETGKLVIYSMGGQVLQTKTVNLVEGANIVDLNMLTYSTGAYKLVLSIDGQETQTEKVIKQ